MSNSWIALIKDQALNDDDYLKKKEIISKYLDDNFPANDHDVKDAVMYCLKIKAASRIIAIQTINGIGDSLMRKYDCCCDCNCGFCKGVTGDTYIYMGCFIVKNTGATPKLLLLHEDFDFEERTLIEVACSSYFLGNVEMYKNISILLLSKMLNRVHKYIIQDMITISSLIKKNSQKRISNKRKKHKFYDEAMRRAAVTWEHFPTISYARMAKALDSFFGDGVSREAIEGWLKDAKLRPEGPVRKTSFTLMG